MINKDPGIYVFQSSGDADIGMRRQKEREGRMNVLKHPIFPNALLVKETRNAIVLIISFTNKN